MSIVKHTHNNAAYKHTNETNIIDFVTNIVGLVYLISCETTTINGLYVPL